jgi:probable rRNA maturation factor
MERQEQSGSDADEGPTRASVAADSSLVIEVLATEADDARVATTLQPLTRVMAAFMTSSMGVVGEVRIRLVRDAEMARAHETHTGVGGTTDVLTFDLREPGLIAGDPASVPMDTDLLLCVDEAARQAEARGIPILHELLLYTVHGILHCLGHDDHDETEAAAMHAREDEILTAIGLGVVFARPVHAQGSSGGRVTGDGGGLDS